jgi:hypothetical protein
MTDRRQVLQAAVLAAAGMALLPGCSTQDGPTAPPPTPDPAQADELALISAYDAALVTAKPADQARLRTIRDEHVAHLRALGWEDLPAPSASGSRTKAQLIRAERRAARVRTQAARDATDAEEAQLLALIAASEYQHVVTLAAP